MLCVRGFLVGPWNVETCYRPTEPAGTVVTAGQLSSDRARQSV